MKKNMVWVVSFSNNELDDGEKVFSCRGKVVDFVRTMAQQHFDTWINFHLVLAEDEYMEWDFILCHPDGTRTNESVWIYSYEIQ